MSTVYTVVPNYRTGNWATGLISYRPTNLVVLGSKTGTPVPLYRDRIKRGVSASSAYSIDICQVLKHDPLSCVHNVWYWSDIQYPLYAYASVGYYTSLGSGTVGSLIPHAASISAECDNMAIARLHQRIRKGTSEVNGLLVLGELRETLGMLRSPFKAFRKSCLDYYSALTIRAEVVKKTVRPKKSDTANSLSYRRAQALKEGMAGSWLELQFGLIPAVSDAKDIVSGLNRTVDTWTERQLRFRSTSKEPTTTYVDINELIVGANYTCDAFYVNKFRRTDCSVQYVAIYRRQLSGSTDFLGRLTDTLGFTLENFIPTVYELVPWSFLFDYFVNVGSIIECSTTSTTGLVTCVKTQRSKTLLSLTEEVSSYSEAGGPFSGARFTKSLTGDRISRRELLRTTLVRSVAESLPIPSVVLSVPGWGSTKWANMAALTANMRDLSRFGKG